MSRVSPVSPRSSCSSPHSVLPPIVGSEKDREFLITLNSYIDKELTKIDKTNSEQRYTVYKSAFDRIIDYVTAYKPLLTAIKAEYEDCIETIKMGQREAFYLSGKLKAIAHEPSTIHNYRKRGDELEHRVSIIKADNKRLQRQLDELQAAREERERKLSEEQQEQENEIKKDSRNIPGLTLQQSTDVRTLTRELDKLDRQLRDLSISQRTRFSAKDFKYSLKEQLAEKVVTRDQLQEQNEILKIKRQKLKIATEAAQAYLKIQPPHQTIGDAVVSALTRARKQHHFDKVGEDGFMQGTPSTTFDDDDPAKEKEAEIMLEYIEKFNELMEEKQFEQAATHAANSPKGVLRTPETLVRFKDVKYDDEEQRRSPLLAFCDALMATVPAYGSKPTKYMSLECAKCALDENRLDLLSHWISQDRLLMSKELGDMIYELCSERPRSSKRCLSMAQQVYTEAECHVLAVLCMVRQGRVQQALEYAQHRGKFRLDDYVSLLSQCPISPVLILGLYRAQTRGHPVVPLGVLLTAVINTEHCDVGLSLVQELQQKSEDVATESTPLRRSVFEDPVTTPDQWLEIIKCCQEKGLTDAAIQILAAVTVLGAVTGAMDRTRQMEREWEEERRLEERREGGDSEADDEEEKWESEGANRADSNPEDGDEDTELQ